MAMKFKHNGDVTIINILGDVDMEEVVQLRNAISTMVHEEHYQLVLDLSKVQHINATGLGIMAESLKKLRAVHGDLRLAHLNPYIQQVFNLTDMTRHFRIYARRQDAIQSYHALTYAAA